MLLELRIENMALIDRLQLDLAVDNNGLAVFTGETGAGKSIILQGIHLLAGGRGASSWIRSNCDKAVVEALFSIRGDQAEVLALLQDNGIDSVGECIIRRVFFRNGRSRFYVNDRLVTAGLVGELTENLINIASQHDHQQLLVARRHLDFLDNYGDLEDLRREFTNLFTDWQNLVKRLTDLQHKEVDKEQRRDFLGYQLAEIEAAGLVPGEDVQLAEERDLLKSSGILAELTGSSLQLLRNSMLDNLSEIRKNMEQASSLDRHVSELAERISSACYEVEDLELALRDYLQSLPNDSSRMAAVTERLSLIKQLQRKYGPGLEDIIEYGSRAAEELASLDSMEKEIVRLEKEVAEKSREVYAAARKLSARRKKVGKRLSAAMQEELADLSFPQAVFEVSIVVRDDADMTSLQATGMDQVEFLFSANPGEPVKPLARIASGGELSRLMLAMKCLLARRDQVETVIFDEVDAGIGGKAAEAVARKIQELSSHHQVLCITHLPQIAAWADEHFMVAKHVVDSRTVSTINRLQVEDRVMELARMLAGENLTDQTIAYARELVEIRPSRPVS
ncbi:MAG: DNA repair protein RecN [Desulfobulbaceae bacterium]|nr:DNA repair protein RecN [Desulfobulbaceae bacterium]